MSTLSADFMTARQLEEILQVNRTTIYRMAERGRVPALKVGGQWRFPRRQIEDWLQQDTEPAVSGATRAGVGSGASATAPDLRTALPLACVQLIQDTFAHVLGLALTLTDMKGNPVTVPSNVCGLHDFVFEQDETHRERQRATYVELSRSPGVQPVYLVDAFGLLCARGMVSLHGENIAMVIAEGIAPDVWPPEAEAIDD
jgi:excisionase family DNA binding protein